MENIFEQLIVDQFDKQIAGDWLELSLSLLISTIFGYTLMKLYSMYFQDNEPQDGSLARSLVLITPTFTAMFWLIQNSLILSLGLLGSLSFVRFRTPIKRSEDIAFVIVAIAVAISSSTGRFNVALLLCSFLFLYSYGRHKFSGSKTQNNFAVVTINVPKTTNLQTLTKIFETAKADHEFVSSRTYDGITSFVFNVTKISKEEHDIIMHNITTLDQKAQISFFYPSERLGS